MFWNINRALKCTGLLQNVPNNKITNVYRSERVCFCKAFYVFGKKPLTFECVGHSRWWNPRWKLGGGSTSSLLRLVRSPAEGWQERSQACVPCWLWGSRSPPRPSSPQSEDTHTQRTRCSHFHSESVKHWEKKQSYHCHSLSSFTASVMF